MRTMKSRRGNRSSNDCCKFAWRPKLLAILLTSALVLSVASSLYCDFVSVTLGFVPNEYDEDVVGVSLWSFEGPDKRCQSFQDAYKIGGFSGEVSYSHWITNGDISWTITRCAAIVGFFFGAIALICILINLFRDEPRLVDVLAYTAIIALISEAAKLGLFFTTDLCVSDNFWYQSEMDEYKGSTSCGMSQGAFICVGSITAYFISSILLIGYNTRPKIDDYNYDESSLQELTVAEKTLTTQTTSVPSEESQNIHIPAWTGSRVEPVSDSVSYRFGQHSDVESHSRRGTYMSEPHSTTSYSDRRQSSLQSYYSEEGGEEDDEYDVTQPLPQFHGSNKPTARRMMDDDVSAITWGDSF